MSARSPFTSGLSTTLQSHRGFPREKRKIQKGPGTPISQEHRRGGPWLPCPPRPEPSFRGLPLSGSGGFLFLTGCFWDNGHLYREDQPSPAPGLRCLNWLDAQGRLKSAPDLGEYPPWVGGRVWRAVAAILAPAHGAFSSPSGSGNHNYCRNPDRDPRGPWCYVSGEAGAPEKRPCEDVRCPGTRTATRDPGLPAHPAEAELWLHPLRTCVRSTRPLPLRPHAVLIGQGCLQAAGLKTHWQSPPL